MVRTEETSTPFLWTPDMVGRHLYQPRRLLRTQASSCCELLALLEEFGDSASYDPRDRVYGLLGLGSDVSVEEFLVDYEIPLIELHKRLVLYYRRQQCTLDWIQSTMSSELVNVLAYSRGRILKTNSLSVGHLTDDLKTLYLKSQFEPLLTSNTDWTLSSDKIPWVLRRVPGEPPFHFEDKVVLRKLFNDTLRDIKHCRENAGVHPWSHLLNRTTPIIPRDTNQRDGVHTRCIFGCKGDNRRSRKTMLSGQWTLQEDIEDGQENGDPQISQQEVITRLNVGIAAPNVHASDEVYQFLGCDVPIIVRKTGDDCHLVSAAIVGPRCEDKHPSFEPLFRNLLEEHFSRRSSVHDWL
ncbi:uncharacterized protein PAC_07172 [Phialocephala subalpina]|uniref:Heterokaryon incompatibility domain-containing protein n=1 Tax=Phialocephala subalpina TaxID=576137 RepID=A0A1L7WX11_9HELO|nr:uncharacterized protein PAC_07172 [Phialocephala subalpina]